ncbi:MAG: type II toxin-antitoxin system VapC family toxin [Deferribacteres bacterium]|nr:type II toxin-antitoxin system VapC family toxin [candidate division KSB1 bacterium]MCB9500463.1 type II toxin-antitoxin system VapC family toxin [Deferribacteres bacterium]
MIVLDTHAWLFWVNDNIEEFTPKGLERIENENTLGVSAISCWEIAMLVAKDRLHLSVDIEEWIRLALKYPGVKPLPLEPEIAILATRLPGAFHKDPADRIIAATCLFHHTTLVSKDRQIHDWGHIPVTW